MKSWQRTSLVLLVLSSCIGCDQVSKDMAHDALRFSPSVSIMGDTVRLLYAENRGVAFSLGSDLPPRHRFWFFTVGAGLLLAGLLFFALFHRKTTRKEELAYALIIGGGVSNVLDRLLNEGHVVDFIMIRVGTVHTAIFNLADVMILAGVVVLFYALWRSERAEPLLQEASA